MFERKLLAGVLFSLALFCTGCPNSKTVVKKVEPQTPPPAGAPASTKKPPKMNGVFYALPQTVLKLDVPITRKDLEPGKYAEFAGFFFPGEEAVEKKDIKFSIGKPAFDSRGEPDPEEIYLVNIQGGLFETKTLLMEYTPEGVLSKAQAESKDETLEFVTGSIKTATSILAPLLLGVPADAPPPPAPKLTFSCTAADFSTQADKDFFNSLTDISEKTFFCLLDDTERAFYRGLSVAQRVFYRLLDKRERSFYQGLATPAARERFQEAKKVYDKIQTLVRQREGLVVKSPDTALPPDTLKTMLKEMDDAILTYKKTYFLGTVTPTTETLGTFEFTPDKNHVLWNYNVMQFSPTRGVCMWNKGNGVLRQQKLFVPKVCPGGGHNCDDGLKAEAACTDYDLVTLSVGLGKDGLNGGQMSKTVSDARLDDSGERGFYYRVPAAALVRLVRTKSAPPPAPAPAPEPEELGRSVLTVAQGGTTVSLPATTKGRRSSYTLALFDSTGALKNFVMASDAAVQQKILTDAEGTADAINKARAGRAKEQAAEEEANDPLTKKKRELEELKTQNAINEEKKKLEQSGMTPPR
jgi:hypothetical protein